MLSVTIASKSYSGRAGGVEILKDVGFTLGPREILAVVGPSGCGKTTLLKIVDGLDTDFSGVVQWSGAGKPRIGTVFQEPRLLPWRTVRQNIDLVVPAGADPGGVEELLTLLGLWPMRDAYPAQLSLGMARRVAIARAFAIGPEIVLLDEPFVSLDATMAARSRGVLLTAWTLRPTAALLVTHDMAEAASLADRIIMLAGTPARVAADIPVPANIVRVGGEAAALFARSLPSLSGGPPADTQKTPS
jgi:NitT/TauT family transport system ATP-binding protein